MRYATHMLLPSLLLGVALFAFASLAVESFDVRVLVLVLLLGLVALNVIYGLTRFVVWVARR